MLHSDLIGIILGKLPARERYKEMYLSHACCRKYMERNYIIRDYNALSAKITDVKIPLTGGKPITYKHNARYYYCLGYNEGYVFPRVSFNKYNWQQECFKIIELGAANEDDKVDLMHKLLADIDDMDTTARVYIFIVLCELALYAHSTTMISALMQFDPHCVSRIADLRLYNKTLNPAQLLAIIDKVKDIVIFTS